MGSAVAAVVRTTHGTACPALGAPGSSAATRPRTPDSFARDAVAARLVPFLLWLFACGSSTSPTDSAALASLRVAPDTLLLNAGQTDTLRVTGFTSRGAAANRLVAWQQLENVADHCVAGGTVGTLGLKRWIRGIAPCRFHLVVSADGRADTSLVIVGDTAAPDTVPRPLPVTLTCAHQVTPDGGTGKEPWSLAYAADGADGRITPGETVCIRAGIYRGGMVGNVGGTASAPVIFRQYPGERAAVDGSIVLLAPNFVWWGMEQFQSSPSRTGGPSRDDGYGIYLRAPGLRLISCIVHDNQYNGIGDWTEAVGAEINGCLIYNNGFQSIDRGHGHSIYAQNGSTTRKLIANTFWGPSYGYGLHIYTESGQTAVNFTVDCTTGYNAGSLALGASPEYYIGGKTVMTGMEVRRSVGFRRDDDWSADFGGGSGPATQGTLRLENDIFVGLVHLRAFQTTELGTSRRTYPTVGDSVIVCPNPYEPGRAHLTILNQAQAATVSVDLSRAGLRKGQAFEIRNAEDFYSAPVLTGIYQGGVVQVPTSPRSVAPVLGTSITPLPGVAEFHAYVVAPAGTLPQ